MPINAQFKSIYSHEFNIDFTHCAPNGYLKYTELCNILQSIAGIHAQLGGISFTDMQQHDQAWVLSRMRIEIKQLPKWRDTIKVETWINTLEKSRSVRAITIYLNDEKIIGAETFWAVFNTQTRRPETLALAHHHFELYPNQRATQQEVIKIDIPTQMKFVCNHQVVLSDLDIVNHVNNVKYLEWCLDTMETESILNKKITTMDMNFIIEFAINEEATLLKTEAENEIFYLIQKQTKNGFVLQLQFE
jgi:medium-chain acyl-[acyl-carrier-protein] hydrolase